MSYGSIEKQDIGKAEDSSLSPNTQRRLLILKNGSANGLGVEMTNGGKKGSILNGGSSPAPVATCLLVVLILLGIVNILLNSINLNQTNSLSNNVTPQQQPNHQYSPPSNRGKSCQSPNNPPLLPLFRTYISGVFDNTAQVEDEKARGITQFGVAHPYALHISGDITNRITNLPVEYKGIFILEESYYTYPNMPTNVSPYIFYFDLVAGSGCPRLTALNPPKGTSPNDLKNNNTNMALDFTKMTQSKFIPPVEYYYDPNAKTFSIDSITPIGGTNHAGFWVVNDETKFRLKETLSARQLEVLEQFIYPNGTVIPYATPLLYERKITNFDELAVALKAGFQIRFSSLYNKCTPAPAKAIGGDEMTNWQLIGDGTPGAHIRFSRAKFIDNYQKRPGSSAPNYVYDYVQMTIARSGNVTYFASDVYPTNFNNYSYEETFNCRLFNAVNGEGATFFRPLPVSHFPIELPNYAQIKAAITQGRPVRFVRDNSACSDNSAANKNRNLISGGAVTTFEEFDDVRMAPYDYFAFSQRNMIKNDNVVPSSRSRYLWSYTPGKVLFNGSVNWRDTFVDPATFSTAQTSDTHCQLHQGTRFFIAE